MLVIEQLTTSWELCIALSYSNNVVEGGIPKSTLINTTEWDVLSTRGMFIYADASQSTASHALSSRCQSRLETCSACTSRPTPTTPKNNNQYRSFSRYHTHRASCATPLQLLLVAEHHLAHFHNQLDLFHPDSQLVRFRARSSSLCRPLSTSRSIKV